MGKNREYMERVLPHIEQLLTTDVQAAITAADVVIVGKRIPDLAQLKQYLRADQSVIDLVRHDDFAPAQVLRIV